MGNENILSSIVLENVTAATNTIVRCRSLFTANCIFIQNMIQHFGNAFRLDVEKWQKKFKL